MEIIWVWLGAPPGFAGTSWAIVQREIRACYASRDIVAFPVVRQVQNSKVNFDLEVRVYQSEPQKAGMFLNKNVVGILYKEQEDISKSQGNLSCQAVIAKIGVEPACKDWCP